MDHASGPCCQVGRAGSPGDVLGAPGLGLGMPRTTLINRVKRYGLT